MLLALSIRDIVLIDRLDLSLGLGLCVLTGETGAGKSVLLDALALALGRRGDSGLVRRGAKQGSVVAEFQLTEDHAVRQLLAEQGIETESGLILRRVVSADGRGRAFINDQPVAVSLLHQVGEQLAEIHGQHDSQSLQSPAMHRQLLDDFAGAGALVADCRLAYAGMRETADILKNAQAVAEAMRADEDYLRHALAELRQLDPQVGEEEELLVQRQLLKQGEKIGENLRQAQASLIEGDGVEIRLRAAVRALERAAGDAGGVLDPAISALDRSAEQVAEAVELVLRAEGELDLNPDRLEEVDDRLFALRDLARKHRVAIEALPAVAEDVAARMLAIDSQDAELAECEKNANAAQSAYTDLAAALSAKRRTASNKLDRALMRELKPLALDKARFKTRIETGAEAEWAPEGMDRVVFEVSTNPGQPLGPLNRIASGGEMARFMLALRIVTRQSNIAGTLIFDEVDAGVGGAVADRVGERLARLAGETQVLLVTHSPQVAARGQHHLRITKRQDGKRTETEVSELDPGERREEVARMLAGATVTDEARAAADRLIAGGRA